jgi:hypothetical protein
MKRLFFLTLLLAPAACDRAATDPSVAADYAAVLTAKTNTLPALLGDALLVAQREDGSKRVAALLTEWEARQAELRALHDAGDRAAVQRKLQALKNEEIRIVLNVFGPEIVPRVIRESYRNLANANVRIHQSARDDGEHIQAQATAQQIHTMLERASAISERDPERALVMATQAAEQLAAIDDLITNLQRVRGIETLFPLAAQQLSAEELARHSQLQRVSALALGSSNRSESNEKLAAVRAEEIRIIVATLGNQASAELLREAEVAMRDARVKLDLMKESGRDVLRLQRMLKSATDFYNHARTAERAGDHAIALDHGSHAAGLLNSLRHLMAR